MAEYKQPTVDRVADLEADVAELRRVLAQLQREPKLVPPQPIEYVRTRGKIIDGYGNTDYPAQVVASPAYELPAIFLDADVPADVADPFEWTLRSAKPQNLIISPGGWIPEDVELKAWFQRRNGRYYVCDVPELRVVTVDTITPGNFGTARLWRAGADTEQEFEIWNDWMNGGSDVEADREARVYLDVDLRRWSITSVEC